MSSNSNLPSPQAREEALFRVAVELTPEAARRAFLHQACPVKDVTVFKH